MKNFLTTITNAELGIVRWENEDGSISLPVDTPRDDVMKAMGVNPAAAWEYGNIYAVYADGRKILS